MSVMIDSPKIRHHMRLNNITVVDLAAAISIDRKTMTTYLDTGTVKKKEIIKPMAEALGVDVTWLYPSSSGPSNNRVVSIKGNKNRQNVAGDHNNIQVNSSDQQSLVEEVEALRQALAAKDAALLAAKDEIIELLKKANGK